MVNFEVFLLSGFSAFPFAKDFWNGLDQAAQRIMLWDIPFNDRTQALQACWEKAHCVALAFVNDQMSAAAWVSRIGAQSQCAMIHFVFARCARKTALPIARIAINRLFAETELQCLLGLIPAKFRHAITFAQKLGFAVGPKLAQACPVNGKLRDGIIVTLNKKDF